MSDSNLIGTAGPTLLDIYEAGREILQSRGTNEQRARKLRKIRGTRTSPITAWIRPVGFVWVRRATSYPLSD
jgi:hypothetical protein